MKRQIVLDTETTGLKTEDGHRIIEIGCIELIDRHMSGNDYHVYLNPQRDIDDEASRIHGLKMDFLATKPTFAQIVAEFLAYLEGSEIIVHNAPFDVEFINYELTLLSHKKTISDYVKVFDTLVLARRLYPGQRNNLDALCKRYKIDNTHRNLHGAMLDARLLTEVYLCMTGKQKQLPDFYEDSSANLNYGTAKPPKEATHVKRENSKKQRQLKIIKAGDEELSHHQEYLKNIKDRAKKCIWDEEE